MPKTLANMLKLTPLIPVITISNVDDAVPLAKALFNGGLPVLEITLRTSVSIAAIKAIKAALPEVIVAAGTIKHARQFEEVIAAGADFGISPGLNETLLSAAKKTALPYLPGVITSSEILTAIEHGYTFLKFFPAELNGGVNTLKSLSAVFPEVSFCPTGGINSSNMHDYLSLNNVVCVGSSNLVTPENIAQKKWQTITEIAKDALNKARAVH